MDKRTPSGGAPILAGLLLLPLLTVAYVLSVGPAICLRESGFLSPKTVNRIYAPLTWLADHSSTFARALVWYAQRWESPREDGDEA